MIDTPKSFTVYRPPHVFSRLESDTRILYLEKYRLLKRTGVLSSISLITISGVVALAKDLAVSKVKAYGYKLMLSLISGPLLQLFALPGYILSYGFYFQKYTVAIMQIGAMITRGEVELVGCAWIIVDFALFGEFVSITGPSEFLIAHNETGAMIEKVLKKLNEDE